MIWKKLADLILKNRITLLIIVALVTVFMGYKAGKVRITFAGSKVLPQPTPLI
jgi:predicted RND superfamily exporter protein